MSQHPQPKKKWNKIAACAALAAAFASATYTRPVSAMAQCCGETAQLALILETMEANFALLYTYMISGEGDVGTGIVGTISGNASGQNSHAEVTKANNESDKLQTRQKHEMERAVTARVARAVADERSCDEIPVIAGARLSSLETAQAAGAATAASYVEMGKKKLAASGASQAGEIQKQLSLYCSDEDALAERCVKPTGGSAPRMPEANARVQSVFAPAYDYGSASEAVKYSRSLTYDPAATNTAQATAARDAASNVTSQFVPANLPKSVMDSPAGRMFVAKAKVFEARMTPAQMVFNGMVARRTAPTGGLTGAAQDAWTVASRRYSAIFPGTEVPKSPSELEALRFEVARRYSDAGSESWQERVGASGDIAQTLQERALSSSVELKILYEMHARLEESAAVRAALLAQFVSPQTSAEVDAASQSAYKAVK